LGSATTRSDIDGILANALEIKSGTLARERRLTIDLWSSSCSQEKKKKTVGSVVYRGRPGDI
jgi:hypothetical protein